MSAIGATETPERDPVIKRLDDELEWYDRKSVSNQRIYKRIKLTEILAAALIPLIAGFHAKEGVWVSAGITGGLGVLVTFLEGLLQLYQFQQNWIGYRATCEALKHEKYLFQGNAGLYAGAKDARALLAERVESLVSQEQAKWISAHQQEKAKGA
jgi:hypothetical protein